MEQYQINAKDWEEKRKEYFAYLDRIKTKIGERLYNFFKSYSLHDGKLISIKVKSKQGEEILKGEKDFLKPDLLSLELDVVNYEKTFIAELRYEDVRILKIEHPSKDLLFPCFEGDLGDWGYDEIDIGEDSYLIHEILFSSGSTITIKSNKIDFIKKSTNKCSCSEEIGLCK